MAQLAERRRRLTFYRVAIINTLGWAYLASMSALVVFVLLAGFSSFGKLKLGPDDSKPEYSREAVGVAACQSFRRGRLRLTVNELTGASVISRSHARSFALVLGLWLPIACGITTSMDEWNWAIGGPRLLAPGFAWTVLLPPALLALGIAALLPANAPRRICSPLAGP